MEFTRKLLQAGGDTLVAAAVVAAGIVLGLLAHVIVMKIVRRLSRNTHVVVARSAVKHLRRPLRLLLPLVGINLLIPLSRLPDRALAVVRQGVGVAVILTVAWLLASGLSILEDFVAARFDVNAPDNLRARKIQTQFRVMKRIAVIVIAIIGLATILMSFDRVRQLGTAILASAGIAGVIVGFAAQSSLSTLLAGLQIAFTQPIRIDDVVIVEGEWGRIEEITLTYVVVRIWDLRRLVVPSGYFLHHAFQNWTRVSAEMLGTVLLRVDYTIPVEEVRAELERILRASERWDGKVCNLQVTDTGERTVELRALMSAVDSPTLWDLRCEVREKLLGFLQRRFPACLPVLRVDLPGQPGGRTAPAAADLPDAKP
jgi:small-conductance mechanosensitive channel